MVTFRRLLAPLLLAACTLAPLAACAEGADARPDAKADAEGWEKVNGGMMMQPGEGFEAKNLVGGAYAFIWVMTAGFVFTVWRRTRAAEAELEALSRRIEAGEKTRGTDAASTASARS